MSNCTLALIGLGVVRVLDSKATGSGFEPQQVLGLNPNILSLAVGIEKKGV